MQIPGEANPELMGIFLFGVSNESETYPGGIWHKKAIVILLNNTHSIFTCTEEYVHQRFLFSPQS